MLCVLHETTCTKRLVGRCDLVVDAARVRLAEAELRSLRQEAFRPLHALVVLALFSLPAGVQSTTTVARSIASSAVYETRCPRRGELVAGLLVGGELRAVIDEVVDLGPVVGVRRPLVERDLVDAPRVLELGEQPDQRLADRAGADHMNDVFLRQDVLLRRRADCN